MLIRIKNLRVAATIGLDGWERERQQNLVVNAELDFDGEAAARSDDIRQSVDYRSLSELFVREVEHSSYGLLESLAARLVDLAMEDKRVRRATVEVDKPSALDRADSVSVVATRTRVE